MASSSTNSSVPKSFKYEVFISFRGDLRKNFVDHLFAALQVQNKIYTYKDGVRIKKGNLIADDLTEAIKDSKFHIIVFSKNYPSSRWCLKELAHIMKCQEETGHIALPLFYDVNPSEVGGLGEVIEDGDQIGEFRKAFEKLKEKMTFEKYHNKVELREAFSKLTNKKERREAFKEWKEKTIEEWIETLERATSLFGLELKKTADGYEAAFIRRIVELVLLELRATKFSTDEKLVGMDSRIDKVLSRLEIGRNDVRMIGIKGFGGAGKSTLARAVFDRVSHEFEAKSFVGNIRQVSEDSSFGLVSLQNQVILDVLNDSSMKVTSVGDGIRTLKDRMGGRKVLLVLDDVIELKQVEALTGELKRFKPGSRIIITTREGHVLEEQKVKVTHNVQPDDVDVKVDDCDVIPLSTDEAIRLFSRSAFGTEIPVQGYEELSVKVLSYARGLPLTITNLGSFLCGKHVNEWASAIERLKTIPDKKTIEVLELSFTCLEDDYKKIFLDVACMMKGWSRSDVIEALKSFGFHAEVALKVLELKSLITGGDNVDMHDHIEEMGRDIVRRSDRERPNRHSRLWVNEEIEYIFANDLGTEATRCIRLFTEKLDVETCTKGLRKMSNIKFLHMRYETPFKNYDDDSSRYIPESLNYLYWSGYPFRSLPATFEANSLVVLRMPRSNIKQLWEGGNPKVFNKLQVLDLSFSKLRTLNLALTPNLETLKLQDCSEFTELRMPIGCPQLRSVHLEIFRAGTFHLGLARNLETLTLVSHDTLVKLYMPHKWLKLRTFKLTDSRLSTLDLGLTPNLEHLELHNCYNLVEVHVPKCLNLTFLKITDSNLRTLKIGLTPNLIDLDLIGCRDLKELHIASECLKLANLSICRSKMTTLDLRLTPNLRELHLESCYNLVEFHPPIGWPKKLVLYGCFGYRSTFFYINDYTSNGVDDLVPLAELFVTPEKCPFHPGNHLPTFEFKSFSKEDLSSLTRSMELLLSKGRCACIRLEAFSNIRDVKLKGSMSSKGIQRSYSL